MPASKLPSKPKIAIIGGSGEFGRLFARIFSQDGHEVVITGRDMEKGERVARSAGASFTTDKVDAAREADVVVISVPIESTVEVIREVAPAIRAGGLLMDFTSVKVEPVKAMLEHAPPEVEVIGSHPMFGPRVASLEGQTVILTPARAERWLEFVEGFFKRHKARVFSSTPEEHDRVMAVVQGLTHFAYITTASTLRSLEVDVSFSRRFASPVYELMLDFIARIVGQNPRLYAAIQMHNPYVNEVHERFIREAEKLRRCVENRDMEGFVSIMSASARIFKDVDSSIGKSDKAISALTSELKRLRSSVGEEVALRHIYSRKIHAGRVLSIDADTVVMESGGRRMRLKLSNVELLGREELLRWKREHEGTVSRDFSYIFPEDVDADMIASAIRNLSDRIVSCRVVDVYRGSQIPAQHKSLTFRAELLGAESAEDIESLLEGLGGRRR